MALADASPNGELKESLMGCKCSKASTIRMKKELMES